MAQFEQGQSGNPGGAPPKALRLSERRRDVLLAEHTIDLDSPAWRWLRSFYPKTDANVKALKAMAKNMGIKGYSKMKKHDLMDKLGLVNGKATLALDTIITLRRVYLFAADQVNTVLTKDNQLIELIESRPDYRAIETLEDRTEGPIEKEQGDDGSAGSIAFIAFVGSEEHRKLQTGQRERMLQDKDTIDGQFKES